MRKTGVIYDIN